MKRIILGLFAALSLSLLPMTVKIAPIKLSSLTNDSFRPVIVASVARADVTNDDKCENGVKLSVTVNKGDGNCLTGKDIIVDYVKIILKFLTFGIGIVITLMIVVAGIQYITANGQPANVAKAKERIKNAITALILFAASAAILNFLIP